MRGTQSRTIDGEKVEVTPWPPRHGIRIQSRLAKIIAPFISKFRDKDFLEQDVLSVLPAVFSTIDEDSAEKLITDILYCVQVEGRDLGNPKNFNDAFTANYLFMYKVIGFALEVNLGDFLEGARNTGDRQDQVNLN